MLDEGTEEGLGGADGEADLYVARMSGMKTASSNAGRGIVLSKDCTELMAAGTIATAQDPLIVEPHWLVSQE